MATVTLDAYEELALAEPDAWWELHCGRLRRKPSELTYSHNEMMWEIVRQVGQQLDPAAFRVRMNAGRARGTNLTYIPDVAVIPIELARQAAANLHGLETYTSPLPFVVEVWSPSTGDYDDDEKFPGYQARGDGEIWRVHPYDETVRVWRRSRDGTYTSETVTSGKLEISSLPGIFVDLDLLFASARPA